MSLKRKILTPFQRFVQIEGFSGILLMIATVVALIWANSPWGASYEALWQYKIGFTSSGFELNKPLILWVNDGLMAIFFFLIGLEIKRELLIGELNSTKKLAFPLFGAIGGIFVPVLLFFLLNQNPDTTEGWGIPMATDIAFSLAIMNLLGDRAPLSLKIFLTAFAIVDDIGAVLAIAVFYSGELQLGLLGMALGLLAVLYLLSYRGYYSKYLLMLLGLVIWTLFLKAGIHPTVAGILLAFSVPVRQKIDTPAFIANLVDILEDIKGAERRDGPLLSDEQIAHIDTLEDWTNQYQSPLQRSEHRLHGWVAYFIVPLFALANTGVVIRLGADLDLWLVGTLAISLVFGKSIGISVLVFLAKRAKLIDIPLDISKRHIIGVSFLAGIGFTMAIFIANLAFANDPGYINAAKIGILIGSFISAMVGYSVLRWGVPSEVRG